MSDGADPAGRQVDLVVGSGIGGLTAALLARSEGLDVLVVEKAEHLLITAAQRHGAAVDLMDEAIWTPVSMIPEGAPVAHLWERWLPHAIIVDGTGQCSVNVVATVERFNRFAEAGRDDDFGRGSSAFDLYFHDPTVKPCPVLGSIARPPFYAVAVYPGDISTYGGLVTDEHARVLRADGSVIDGLFAAGSTATSVCGHRCPGAEIAVGGSAAFGYLGAQHVALRARECGRLP